MKNIEERLSEEMLRQYDGLYVYNQEEHSCKPLNPYFKGPLTNENFGLIDFSIKKIWTLDEFFLGDGNRNFIFGKKFCFDPNKGPEEIKIFLVPHKVPNEVADFLYELEIIKKVRDYLNTAREEISSFFATNSFYFTIEWKEFDERISEFDNTSDFTEKLKIATATWSNVVQCFIAGHIKVMEVDEMLKEMYKFLK